MPQSFLFLREGNSSSTKGEYAERVRGRNIELMWDIKRQTINMAGGGGEMGRRARLLKAQATHTHLCTPAVGSHLGTLKPFKKQNGLINLIKQAR